MSSECPGRDRLMMAADALGSCAASDTLPVVPRPEWVPNCAWVWAAGAYMCRESCAGEDCLGVVDCWTGRLTRTQTGTCRPSASAA